MQGWLQSIGEGLAGGLPAGLFFSRIYCAIKREREKAEMSILRIKCCNTLTKTNF